LRAVAIAVAIGAALGVATKLIVELPNPVGLLGTLGGPWLATAFVVGVVAPKPPGGTLGRRGEHGGGGHRLLRRETADGSRGARRDHRARAGDPAP
jgi:hypothetical protein